MSETQNAAAKLLNPWAFHLQKLELELKCPLCLSLLNKPMLLPCNHIFCNSCIPESCRLSSSQCPACQQHFTNREIRPASCMENIVAIYKSLDATFNSAILPLLSTDSGTLTNSTSVGQLIKRLSDTVPTEKNDHIKALLMNSLASGIELTKCSVTELDVNHAPEISPGSSPSSVDAKGAEGHNKNASRNRGTENHKVKKSVGDNLNTVADGMNNTDTFHLREPKRLKKLNYGSSDAILQSHGRNQQMVSDSDQAAISNCNEKFESKKDIFVTPATSPCDASYMNGTACALCHTSKITERTGELLHYADGKEVSSGETAFSKAIPLHRKCIEWTPQVYFVGETIKNLESELARASKLKCASCGLKGAALGCFAKSCRRSYHVPCAVEIPECRWDCDDFLMLCPSHKSIRFPSEKSNSRKRDIGEKSSPSCQIEHSSSRDLSFWASSASGLREWVFCGSALSTEEKCLLVKFAALCGATVFKFWSPNVTHVIAATDSNGACSRTLKVLMGILNGRWILNMDWIKACLEANCHVNEEPYEVNIDNHGCCDGPRTGRISASNNAPKLFDGLSFYFTGDFISSYKRDLLDLVTVGGGTVIESMEQLVTSTSFVVYNHDYPQGCVPTEASSFVFKRLAEAKDVAKGIDGAHVIRHTWILESIAACRVLPYP